MDTFLTLFSESQLHALLLTESTGAKVVEKFLQILQVKRKEKLAEISFEYNWKDLIFWF